MLRRPAEEAEQVIGQLAEAALARRDADQAASDSSSVIVSVRRRARCPERRVPFLRRRSRTARAP